MSFGRLPGGRQVVAAAKSLAVISAGHFFNETPIHLALHVEHGRTEVPVTVADLIVAAGLDSSTDGIACRQAPIQARHEIAALRKSHRVLHGQHRRNVLAYEGGSELFEMLWRISGVEFMPIAQMEDHQVWPVVRVVGERAYSWSAFVRSPRSRIGPGGRSRGRHRA